MIRLIVSDVDGTLAPEGARELDPHLFNYIRQLQERGIRFAAASGRQYESMLNVLFPVWKDILFIADNGAYILEAGNVLMFNTFPGDTWKSIVCHIRKIPDSHFIVSSVRGTYTESKNRAFLRLLEENYAVRMNYVPDVTQLEIQVSKVGLYLDHLEPEGIAKEGTSLFGQTAHVVASGSRWVDFVASGTDKGVALHKLQQMLHIRPDETMVFGDNNNDIGMLKCAEESFVMPGSPLQVRSAAKHVMEEKTEGRGVLKVLETVIQRYPVCSAGGSGQTYYH